MGKFSDIINGDKPVLIDFFATWCGPCKTMAPVIEMVGKEMHDKMRTLKVDVDKNNAVAAKYRIQSVPTLILFYKGEVKWRHSGFIDKASLMQQLKKNL